MSEGPLRIEILGPVEVVADGRRPLIGQPRRRGLLAILALEAGQACAWEFLADALWGERPPRDARAVLQTHVAKLRRELQPDRPPGERDGLLRSVSGGYRLDLLPEAVDAHRFATRVESGRRQVHAYPVSALSDLEEALALWRGPPLADLGNSSYAMAERMRLDELRLTARTARLACLLALGRDEEVAADAQALVAEQPLNESVTAALTIALYRRGRQAEALEHHRVLRGRLTEELGVSPSPTLQSLELAILRQDAELHGSAPLQAVVPRPLQKPGGPVERSVPYPAQLRVNGLAPLVGRARERHALEEAWSVAMDSGPRLALVAGEAGVGKTRLVAELARSLHERGATVLAGRCDAGLAVPYQPVVEALAHHVRHAEAAGPVDRLGPAPEQLARIHPPLAEVVGTEPAPGTDPQTDRYRLFEAVTGWLRSLSRASATLLVLEDVHWAAETTLLLLRHLLRAGDLDRLLLVATYRHTDLDPDGQVPVLLSELRLESTTHHLGLEGLTPSDVAEFLRHAQATESRRHHDGALARRVHTHTAGNPLFIEELLHHHGDLTTAFTQAASDEPADPGAIRVPERVQELASRRLQGLSETTREVLRTASLVGHEWDLDTVAAAVGSDDAGMVRAVEEGVRAGILRELDRRVAACEFSHDIIRRAITQELSRARRHHEHRRIADAIEALHGQERIGEIAAHLRQAATAADPERAITASLLAAEQARRHAALDDAHRHCRHAVDHLDLDHGDPLQTTRLRALLGDTMYATGIDWERGLEQLDRARADYERLGHRRSAAKIRSRIGRNLATFLDHIDVRRAHHEVDAALDILEPLGDSAPLAYALLARAAACGWDLRTDAGLQAARRALALAEQLDNPVLTLNARMLVGQHTYSSGDLEAGEQAMAAAHTAAVEQGEPILSWVGAYLYALCGNLLYDPLLREQWVREQVASQRYDAAPGLRAALLGLLCEWAFRRGAYPEAERLARELPRTPLFEAHLASAEGRWDESLEIQLALADEALAVGNANSGLVMLCLASGTCELQGGVDEAISHARRALAILPPDAPTWAQLWARTRLATVLAHRDRDTARDHVDICRAILRSGEDYRGLDAFVGIADGVTAATVDEADHAFDRARTACRRAGTVPLEAETLWRWAQRTGRTELLDASAELYQRLGVGRPWLDHVRSVREHVPG